MRPIIRLLVRKNVLLQVFVDLIKETYVNIAEENLKAAGLRVTDSQISLMTGVHRRDVHKYKNLQPDTGRDIPNLSIAAEIMAIWLGKIEYLDPRSQPRPLPYNNSDNPAMSFSGLAESVSTDVRPRAILDEMLRQNLVHYDEIADKVWLNTEAFIPYEGWAEKLYFFARNGADHLDAAVTNILSSKPPFLERSVYYNGLTRASADELQRMARDNIMRLLRGINRRAHDLSQQDKNAPDARHRITFGTYFFTDSGQE